MTAKSKPVFRLLILALVFATGCTNRNETQTVVTPTSVPKLDGRWWVYAKTYPVDIKGAHISGTCRGEEISGELSLEGQQLYILAPAKDGLSLAMVGRYQEYPTAVDFLRDHGLFDMGSAYGDAKERLRVLTLEAGYIKLPEAFKAADWNERRCSLSSSFNIQWVSPASQRTGGAAWKQSVGYEPDSQP